MLLLPIIEYDDVDNNRSIYECSSTDFHLFTRIFQMKSTQREM